MQALQDDLDARSEQLAADKERLAVAQRRHQRIVEEEDARLQVLRGAGDRPPSV